MTQGISNDLCAILQVELRQNIAQVVFHRVLADDQSLRQLAIRRDPLHEQLQHVALTIGQPG